MIGAERPDLSEILAFCSENGLCLLFASVTGSRAMGLQSAASDFDVRGVVVRSLADYVTLDEPRRKLDSWGYERKSMDLQLWDIRKACSLLASSNQRALEMLFSPLEVFDLDGFGDKLKARALSCLSLSRLALHFVNDAEMHYSRFICPFEKLDCKKYIFLLRSVFAIRCILAKKHMPPINYDELMKGAGDCMTKETENVLIRLLMLKRSGDTLEKPREPLLEQFYLASDLGSLAKQIVETKSDAAAAVGKDHFDLLIVDVLKACLK
jgi:predicted nucleotidyltransferase